MINKLNLKEIAENENARYVDTYLKTIINNLDAVIKEESKNTMWSFLIVLIFLLFTQADISSLKLGFVEIKDIGIIPKILPVIYIYILFNMEAISDHKQDLQRTLTFVANIMYKQQPSNNFLVHYKANSSIHALHPFNFDDHITKLMHQRTNNRFDLFNYFFNFVIKVIGILPYLVIVYMLYYLQLEYYESLIGKLGFWLTITLCCALILFKIKHGILDRRGLQEKRDREQQEILNELINKNKAL